MGSSIQDTNNMRGFSPSLTLRDGELVGASHIEVISSMEQQAQSTRSIGHKRSCRACVSVSVFLLSDGVCVC